MLALYSFPVHLFSGSAAAAAPVNLALPTPSFAAFASSINSSEGANEALPIRAIPGRGLPLHHTLGRWQGRIGRPTLLRSMHDRRQGRSQHHVFTVAIIAMVAAFRDLSPPLVGGSNAASGRGKQVRDFGKSRDTHTRSHARTRAHTCARTHARTHTRTHLTRSTSAQQLFSFFHCWESAFNEELPEAFPPAHNH